MKPILSIYFLHSLHGHTLVVHILILVLNWDSSVSSSKLDSHLPKKLVLLLQRKPFKKDEKCFLFHIKSFFRSQDIQIFVLTFWSFRKNGLIRKIRLISRLWRHSLVYKKLQHTYYPISQEVRGNQAMEFGQVIKDN